MKKLTSLLLLFFALSFMAKAQVDKSWLSVSGDKNGILNIYYYENYPFAYKDDLGNLAGIEIEIVHAFIKWVEDEKGVKITPNFTGFDEFDKMYRAVSNVKNGVIGLGSVSINNERKKEVLFSTPYIKNKRLFVTPLNVSRINAYEDIPRLLEGKTALVIKGSSLEKDLLSIKEQHFPKMRVEFMDNQYLLLEEMAKNNDYYGMVDLLSFWHFTKNNGGVLKAHRAVSTRDDMLAFIMPLNSDWNRPLTDFFEGGFGFTSTKTYRDILVKYLGYEVIESVELH